MLKLLVFLTGLLTAIGLWLLVSPDRDLSLVGTGLLIAVGVCWLTWAGGARMREN